MASCTALVDCRSQTAPVHRIVGPFPPLETAMRRALALAVIATLAAPPAWTTGAGAAGRDAIAAIEFHHVTRDHDFLTADDAEIVLRDAMVARGWVSEGAVGCVMQ